MIIATAVSSWAGSQLGAERIVKEQRLAELEWQQELLAAQTLSEKSEVYEKRPNNEIYTDQMFAELESSLDEPWVMPYIVWQLQYRPYMNSATVIKLIEVVEKYHTTSPQLGEFCIAIVAAGASDLTTAEGITTSQTLKNKKENFINKVIRGGKTAAVRGQAAFALSAMVAQLGDSPEVNKRRFDLLRKAIIDAADSKVGEVTLADLAKEEIYRMTKLSKGAVAPNLVGSDTKGMPLKLSDIKGRVTVLVFWRSWENYQEVSRVMKKLAATYAGQPVEIIGVSGDFLSSVRELEKMGEVTGRTFADPYGKLFQIYRVTDTPMTFVIDREGKIQYNGVLSSFVDLTVSALLAPEQE
ncbi:peroxiredoxin family protein [Rubritalea spongiae]|uniref:Peroxiredoxin family protein n=1 Tax=Rubritalea spongiae TaxID=430797 RepID=A0ABW5E1R4_9BACT